MRVRVGGDTVNQTAPIGLVGIGLVGTALARSLLADGYSVLGFDIDETRAQALISLGGSAAPSAAAVGRACSCVILSLHNSDIVRDVVEGADGLMSEGTTVTLIIDTTTGVPADTIALEQRLLDRGCAYLDATISGSSAQIGRREGVFLVGGRPAAFDRASEILNCCATRVFHVGPPGDGAKTKLASNLILGLNRASLAEGFVFAERLGLDLSRFAEILRHTPASSAALENKAEKMITGNYEPQSRVAQHRKDLDIILEHGQRNGQPLPLTAIHHRLLKEAERMGLADADTAAVIEAIRCAGKSTVE